MRWAEPGSGELSRHVGRGVPVKQVCQLVLNNHDLRTGFRFLACINKSKFSQKCLEPRLAKTKRIGAFGGDKRQANSSSSMSYLKPSRLPIMELFPQRGCEWAQNGHRPVPILRTRQGFGTPRDM